MSRTDKQAVIPIGNTPFRTFSRRSSRSFSRWSIEVPEISQMGVRISVNRFAGPSVAKWQSFFVAPAMRVLWAILLMPFRQISQVE